MSTDTAQVVALLEQALADAVAGQLVGMTLALVDEDGITYVYAHAPSVRPVPCEGRALQ